MDENDVLAAYLTPCVEIDTADLNNYNPPTPLTPSTPSTIDDPTERAAFSMSMDSGFGSPANLCVTNGAQRITDNLHEHCDDHDKQRKKNIEHITKEKQRRDRIKDSCDQLRSLLPYIQGRKTDMASILEMSVDYLKMVNNCMPKDLKDQIIKIMSRDNGKPSNKRARIEQNKCARIEWDSKDSLSPTISSIGVKPETDMPFPKCIKLQQRSSLGDVTRGVDENQFPDCTENSLSPFSGVQKSFSDIVEQIYPFNSNNKPVFPPHHPTDSYQTTRSTGETTLYHYYPISAKTNRLYHDFINQAPALTTPQVSNTCIKSDLLLCATSDQEQSVENKHNNGKS